VLRLGIPLLTTALLRAFGFDLTPYDPLIVSLMIVMMLLALPITRLHALPLPALLLCSLVAAPWPR